MKQNKRKNWKVINYRCKRLANNFVHQMEMNEIHEFPSFSPIFFKLKIIPNNSL